MIEVEERFENDRRAFYIKGIRTLHREGGTAIEWVVGKEEWCINGRLHREDGPAIKYYSGRLIWLLEGKVYSKEEWFQSLTEEQKEKMLYSEYFIKG